MSLFKKKVVPVAPAPTTEQLIEKAVNSVQRDIKCEMAAKDSALSVFRATATKLQNVNNGLEKSIATLNSLMEFATTQKESSEKAISDNEKVIKKILAIIGE